MKNLITFNVWHMEDRVPEEVIFNVEFFNAAYMAACLRLSQLYLESWRLTWSAPSSSCAAYTNELDVFSLATAARVMLAKNFQHKYEHGLSIRLHMQFAVLFK
ncbi:hypothetical protein PHYSODRAFT_300961 [Phytophthora sojae]|uniref:Uncharacterized protein n=1 Tax=Phytophthora sojae (strain P6497) TaxID=1094619 RepID=G4ZJB7_PHYSP|nr:hypothetical protein PHYSODRAFT_300961 [Phytophthora sojae]EGZ18191.1 hypothetical protein PHYSODRAFT_300961 [Phytophthora sojae]|eukprot:XP_009527249.1 hypothetical protein PHYSODRAFT_300961 [Phytophthora sojae]